MTSTVTSNPPPTQGGEAPSVRMLVVDDQPDFVAFAATVLGSDPRITVVGTAEGGEGALALLAEAVPDVAVVDIDMPGLDGFETAQRLIQARPGLRVVLVSNVEARVYRDLARVYGATGFLPKRKLTPDALLALLAEEVGARRPPAESPAPPRTPAPSQG